MNMDIITVGLAVCDILAGPVTPALFRQDSTPVDMEFRPGGDACNVAINAAALGVRTGLVTVLGEDANGAFLRDHLAKYQVDLSATRTSASYPTSTSIVLTEPGGERHFLPSTGIFRELSPEQITADLLRGAKILSLNSCYRLPQLDDGGVVPVFQLAHSLGLFTAMDTTFNRSGDWLARIEPALYHTDLFLPSYQEATHITGKTDVRDMAEVLSRYGLKILAIKLGEQGSYVTDFREEHFIRPFPVPKVVSTVGAGDSYVAGFLTAQARGMGLYESAVFASAVAAFTVQVMGAVGGVPPLPVVENFIRENRYRIEP